MSLSLKKLASTPTVLATLGIVTALILAAVPTSNADHLGTGGMDVRVDADVTETAYYNGTSLGTVNPVRTPGGYTLRAFTAYELSIVNITGFGNATQVEIISPNGTVRVSGTPLVTGYDGAGSCTGGASPGCLKNATFLVNPSSFNAGGVYVVRGVGTGTMHAYLYVAPQPITVAVSPNPITYTGQSQVVTYTTSVGGAKLSGPCLDPSATTDSNGQYATVQNCPGPGNYTVAASKQTSNQTTQGVDVPEYEGSGAYSVQTPVTKISIGNVSGSILYTVQAPIKLENVTNFGAATVRLTFDPAVVSVVNVTNTSVPNGNLTWDVNESAGTMTLLVTTTARPGANGTYNLGVVHLQTVGSAGDTSALDITIDELVDSDGNAINATAIDGSFRAGILGDADGDGDIDQDDVLAISEVVVGKRSASTIVAADADVSKDGSVTGKDAMFLSQYLAGTRPTL